MVEAILEMNDDQLLSGMIDKADHERITLRHAPKLNQETNTNKNPRIGSTLEDFLKEEGIYEDVSAQAIEQIQCFLSDKEKRHRIEV